MDRTELQQYCSMLVLCSKLTNYFSIYFTVRTHCCINNRMTDIFKEFVKCSNNKYCGYVWAKAIVRRFCCHANILKIFMKNM